MVMHESDRSSTAEAVERVKDQFKSQVTRATFDSNLLLEMLYNYYSDFFFLPSLENAKML
jgi:hypothetical protein